MVLVTWHREAGVLEHVRKGDGPGDFTDDVAVDEVRKALADVESLSENLIASTVLSVYEGELRKYDCHVTVDTFSESDYNHAIKGELSEEDGDLVTTIAFVEMDNEEDRLDTLRCDECDFNPTETRLWAFDIRTASGWTYHDWNCPECWTTVHSELVEVDSEDPFVEEKVH